MMLNEEIVLGLVIATAIFLGPWIIAIIALVRCSTMKRELEALEQRLARYTRRAEEAPVTPVREAPSRTGTSPDRTQAVAQRIFAEETPVLTPPAPVAAPEAKPDKQASTPVPPPLPTPGKARMELKLGGHAASFIGIATLVIGLSYLIVYAIQNNWVTPAMRIIGGLCAAIVLIVIGYIAERRGRDLAILSRALTGGGVALFYFCVFSAYQFHQLIGGVTCAAGLVASAIACLTLATRYSSQSIAILGVLGAFLTPMLVDAMDLGTTFVLAYIAGINVPVIFLGVHRRWQPLYNLSLFLTVVVAFAWMARNVFGAGDAQWETAICYTAVYFLEFAALGLLKLRGEPNTTGRTLDIWRLTTASLLLYFALFGILTEARQTAWLAEAYLAAGLVHALLAGLAWRLRPMFKEEVLALTSGAILFVTVAVPAELDGTVVSVVWAIEGVLLAMFGLRAKSALLVEMAALVGVTGLFKVLLWDVPAADRDGALLFRNTHFYVSLITVLGLAAQSVLHSRTPQASDSRVRGAGSVLGVGAPLGFLAACGYDLASLANRADPWFWNLTSISLALTAILALLLCAITRAAALRPFTWFILMLLPLKMLVWDAWLGAEMSRPFSLFTNYAFFIDLGLLGLALYMASLPPLARQNTDKEVFKAPNVLGSLCILAGIAIFWRDIFTLMPDGNDFTWVLSSATLLMGALAGLTLGRKACFSGVRTLSSWLVVLALLKITTLDTMAGFERANAPWPVLNAVFGCQLGMLVVTGAWHWITGDRASRWARWHAWAVTAFLALVAFIALTTTEFIRVDAEWCRTAITLWWALCGLVLAISGLIRNVPALRYAALALFGMTIAKVFIVDLSGLDGIMRIAAFIGVGLLLLVLSYVYQKLSPTLIARWDDDGDADANA